MKNTIKNILGAIAGMSMAAGMFSSCDSLDYPDRHKVAEGSPVIYSVRYADRDKHITSAYMDEVVCLLGDNLRSVTEIWFNDQKAILNTSYITENTIIVSIPKTLPEETTDMMYVLNSKKDTTKFDFKVLPPVPKVISMSNEWAKEGEEVTIYGDFLIDDPASPMEILFPNAEVPHEDMTFDGTSAVTFHVPAGATAGYVNINTISGGGRSKFQYLDSRNILFDFDGSHGAMQSGYGWRAGMVHAAGADGWADNDGSYLYFGGATIGAGIGETWAEDQFCFNYWPEPGSTEHPELSAIPEFAEYIETYDVGGLQLKFEVLIPSSSPWSSAVMQIMFTGNDLVTYATGNNNYYGDTSLPRACWAPWEDNGGSYDTGGKWVTVTIPLSSFSKTNENKDSGSVINKNMLTGLTFFVWHGDREGTECNPEFGIDNIRVVPVE